MVLFTSLFLFPPRILFIPFPISTFLLFGILLTSENIFHFPSLFPFLSPVLATSSDLLHFFLLPSFPLYNTVSYLFSTLSRPFLLLWIMFSFLCAFSDLFPFTSFHFLTIQLINQLIPNHFFLLSILFPLLFALTLSLFSRLQHRVNN